jgi:diaminohydroxyphosphoribosylaminopyrimidine deaminase/5-amino-6-(5-phosphoribosylamino)uracil reductase
VRDWKGKNPVRVVLDRELKLDVMLNLYDQSAHTLIYNGAKNESEKFHEFIRINFHEHVLRQVLNSLVQKNIQSLMVEGGTKLLQSFIDENLWDEARIFTGSQFFGSGVRAPAIKGTIISEENILDDRLVFIRN